MQQPLRVTRTQALTCTTSAQQVSATSVVVRQAFFKARATNSGIVKLLGWNAGATTPAADADGITLAAGQFLPAPAWIADLNQVAYMSSTNGDVLEVMYSL